MSVLVVLEKMDKPEGCRSCPFLNEDFNCCELLSVAADRTINVNKYSTIPSSKCPIIALDKYHGRLIDERDIRQFFGLMPFKSDEGKFSMTDVFSNIAGIKEVVPRYMAPSEMAKRAAKNIKEKVKDITTPKEEIEKEIEDAGEDN